MDSLLESLWGAVTRSVDAVSSWSGDRWIAIAAIVVAGVGTCWQAAEARGAKNVARRALADTRRSADAAVAAAASARESAEQAQRVADIEAGRDHEDRRRRVSITAEVRSGQRIARLKNGGQQALRVKAVVIPSGGSSSRQASDEEVDPGAVLDLRLGAVGETLDRLDIYVDGECPCSNAESTDSHWLIKYEIPPLT